MTSLEDEVDPTTSEREDGIALADSVVMREFVAETVLLDISTGQYYRLQGKPADMTVALIELGNIDAAAVVMGGDIEDPEDITRAEVVGLYHKLSALQLIEDHQSKDLE